MMLLARQTVTNLLVWQAELADNLAVGYKKHDADDPKQTWEELAAVHVAPVR